MRLYHHFPYLCTQSPNCKKWFWMGTWEPNVSWKPQTAEIGRVFPNGRSDPGSPKNASPKSMGYPESWHGATQKKRYAMIFPTLSTFFLMWMKDQKYPNISKNGKHQEFRATCKRRDMPPTTLQASKIAQCDSINLKRQQEIHDNLCLPILYRFSCKKIRFLRRCHVNLPETLPRHRCGSSESCSRNSPAEAAGSSYKAGLTMFDM